MTGLYTMALCGGAASAAALTLPIAHYFDDSWAAGLAAWALPAAVVLLIWAPQSLRAEHASRQARRSVSGLWSDPLAWQITFRSEEHTSELQSLMRNSYAVFCLKKKIIHHSYTLPQQ